MDGADGVLCATSRHASDINYGALTMAVRSDDRNRSRLDIVPGKHARGGGYEPGNRTAERSQV